jgi:hypothetical protein
MAAHRLDREDDSRCACGALVTWYDGPEQFGYGCEQLGRPTRAFERNVEE